MLRKLLLATLITTASVSGVASTNIIINMPPDREVAAPPRPDLRCRVVPATYHHGVWSNQYRVCETRNNAVWTSGYWQCTHLKHHNTRCSHWEWVPSRWNGRQVVINGPSSPARVQTTVVYASPARPHEPVQVVMPAQQVYASPAPRQREPIPAPQSSAVQISVSR